MNAKPGERASGEQHRSTEPDDTDESTEPEAEQDEVEGFVFGAIGGLTKPDVAIDTIYGGEGSGRAPGTDFIQPFDDQIVPRPRG